MTQDKEITFERMPEAIAEVLRGIGELKQLVTGLGSAANPSAPRRLIGIDEVCGILGKAKPTVYAMACQRRIPCYKSGRKLYFYEDEIVRWIEQGRRKTMQEMMDESRNRR